MSAFSRNERFRESKLIATSIVICFVVRRLLSERSTSSPSLWRLSVVETGELCPSWPTRISFQLRPMQVEHRTLLQPFLADVLAKLPNVAVSEPVPAFQVLHQFGPWPWSDQPSFAGLRGSK